MIFEIQFKVYAGHQHQPPALAQHAKFSSHLLSISLKVSTIDCAKYGLYPFSNPPRSA